jgi:hypothetical protein
MTRRPTVHRSPTVHPWGSVRRTLFLATAAALALVLSACGGAAPGATTGSLRVVVDGLPAGSPADVAVTGPAGYASSLTATATLAGLAPGTYAVTAASVGSYDPVVPLQVAEVETGLTTTVSVTYAEPTGGALHECVPYAPSEAGGDLSGTWSTSGSAGAVTQTIISPGDPGGGYITINLRAPEAIVPRLNVQVLPEQPTQADIFSTTAGNSDDTQFIEVVFEVGPGRSFEVTTAPFSFSGSSADVFPAAYTASWTYTSRVDCYEPNDTRAQAKAVPLDLPIDASFIAGYRESNSITTNHETTQDWYRFELDTAREVAIALTNVPSNVRARVTVFSESSTIGSVLADAAGDAVTVAPGFELAAGWYAVRVDAPQGVARKAHVSHDDAFPAHFASNYTLEMRTVD